MTFAKAHNRAAIASAEQIQPAPAQGFTEQLRSGQLAKRVNPKPTGELIFDWNGRGSQQACQVVPGDEFRAMLNGVEIAGIVEHVTHHVQGSVMIEWRAPRPVGLEVFGSDAGTLRGQFEIAGHENLPIGF